jgi:hypothetical protein
MAMVLSRLRLRNLPFDYWHCHDLPDKRVVAFVVKGDQVTTLYDEAELFPSDAFTTQLRMLMG